MPRHQEATSNFRHPIQADLHQQHMGVGPHFKIRGMAKGNMEDVNKVIVCAQDAEQ